VNDPARMKRSDETPEELRALLGAASAPTPLGPNDRAKILASAAAIAAGGVAASATAVAAGASVTRSALWTMATLTKTAGLAGLVLAAGLAAREVTRRAQAPTLAHRTATTALAPRPPTTIERPIARPIAAVPAPRDIVAVTPPTAEVSTAQPATRPARAQRPSTIASSAPTSTVPLPTVARAAIECPVSVGAGGLEAESRVLAAATAALASAPAVSAACVRELERGPISDSLRDERHFIAFEAARRMGSIDEATRRARRIIELAPTSGYAARAQRWLDAQPTR
jgi:hypothetical protein